MSFFFTSDRLADCLKRLTILMAPTNARAVAQRSLYFQHIMPHSVDVLGGDSGGGLSQPSGGSFRGSGLVESIVTPLRAGPFQSNSSQRKPSSRAIQALGNHQAAASFDAAFSQQQPQPPRTPVSVSCQQKLLQLQLLHNSNNVDYIRQSSGANGTTENGSSPAATTAAALVNRMTANDYQIYGPESTVYGYSSMRSNLKSAASEFSFIRPSSSSHIQSSLPHQNSAHVLDQAAFLRNGLQQQHQQLSNESAAFARSPSLRAYGPPNNHHQLRDNNNNFVGGKNAPQQFLIDPKTGQPLQAHLLLQQKQQSLLDVELIAPIRELPLKPNKKRTRENEPTTCNINPKILPKSSSLTSRIASFFRRTFSRRSKRRSGKRRSKLAESCSTSLGAFENENFASIPIVPSAYSTGSKSVDGRQVGERTNHQQPQRMVDMIEAFTSGNFVDQADVIAACHNQSRVSQAGDFIEDHNSDKHRQSNGQKCKSNQLMIETNQQQQAANVTPARLPGISQGRADAINEFASPLHKSNSISATMGLSLVSDNSIAGKRAANFVYDNELRAVQQQQRRLVGGSPVLHRSAKVLSANLTPLRDPMNQYQHHHHRLSVLSPRNTGRLVDHHQLPRPSSIYGQPSMIAAACDSPVASRVDERNNNFGLQRNSIHGYNITKIKALSSGVGCEMMKTNQLCTTQEEASEELSSPLLASEPKSAVATIISKAEFNDGLYDNRSPMIDASHYVSRAEALSMMTASPSNHNNNNNRPTPQHRRAVVNPILQSPTMDTIYDNNPMMLNGVASRGNVIYQSNYDNHHNNNHNQHIVQLDQGRLGQQQSPMIPRRAKPSNSMTQFYPSGDHGNLIDESPYSSERMIIAQSSATPNKQNKVGLFLSGNNKPAAIVAPSTPSRLGVSYDNNHMDHPLNRPSKDQVGLFESGFPLVRYLRNAPIQQSPLIYSDNKPRDPIYSTRNYGQQTLAVNIAGAPGINLDPALAASLLRGTNIDAYESSTYQIDNQPTGNQLGGGDTSKTFLVSTRLSKSMAHHQSSSSQSNTGGSSSSSSHNANSDTFRKSSVKGDEISSSTRSQSITSSRSHSSSRANHSNRRKFSNSTGPYSSSQEEPDQLGSGGDGGGAGCDSSSMESDHRADRSRRAKERKNSGAESSCSSSSRSDGRGSKASKRLGSEQSDKAESLDSEKLDSEKNWITSKLIGRQQQQQ